CVEVSARLESVMHFFLLANSLDCDERQRRSISQPRGGATQSAYPGLITIILNPNGVPSTCQGCNPVGVVSVATLLPKVARASQPRAERWNAVGVSLRARLRSPSKVHD